MAVPKAKVDVAVIESHKDRNKHPDCIKLIVNEINILNLLFNLSKSLNC